MKFRFFAVCAAALLICSSAAPGAQDRKPNILFILCDDLGYGDVGVFYQNSRRADQPRMKTPELDRMAAEGMILRQHYTASPVCAPARASLLLGQHQGNCPIRDNQFDKALPRNHTLGSVLQAAGYYTGMIGKFGLQGPTPDYPGHPLRHGFDEFYGVLAHGAAHFHYPGNSGKIMDMFTPVTSGLAGAYDTDLYAARAKKFIRERAEKSPAQPFFLYLAFTAPHFFEELPTQAYPEGRGLHGGLQWPLNTIAPATNSWYHPDYAKQNWPDVEKRHATMIRRVDDAVGDILQLLRDLNIDKDTLVIFTSDNGPHNEKGQDPSFFDSWGVMDGIKRDLWEAGVREPTLALWPGHIRAGSVDNQPSAFWDWMPTFADLAGLAPPAESDGVSILPTLTGHGRQRSRGFMYFEYDYSGNRFPIDKVLGQRKHVGKRNQMQSIRLGNFTAVRYSITNAAQPFRLYNVVSDPHEDYDLAGDAQFAALLAQARTMTEQVRRPEPSAPRPYDLVPVPAVSVNCTKEGVLNCAAYLGRWPWVPDLDALMPVSARQTAGVNVSSLPAEGEAGLAFKGFFNAPAGGEYTFWLQCDTGAELWLHEAHVLDDDFAHDGKEVTASIRLAAGLHPFRLFYRHKAGAPKLVLEYAGPGIPRQAVPAAAFSAACAESSAGQL
ncbi:MAG TPA: sulfatase-like hydrolase/transferase [Verrucomicrobiae bacterium]|jgi:arylsulfatase A-like enzyme